jgi:hypothetical protein
MESQPTVEEMLANYTKLTEIPDSDWEYLPTNEVNAGEFEGDHTLKVWRILKEDGTNCTQIFAKMI